MAKSSFLEEVYPPIVAKSGGTWRSGLYKIIDPDLRSLFSEDEIEAEKQILDNYERSNKLGKYAEEVKQVVELNNRIEVKEEVIAETPVMDEDGYVPFTALEIPVEEDLDCEAPSSPVMKKYANYFNKKR